MDADRAWMRRCSLRVTGVGCPEHDQVGPLPWLSKSRLACGHLVGVPDSEVPICNLLGNAHITRSPSGARQCYDGLFIPNEIRGFALTSWEPLLPWDDLDVKLLQLRGLDFTRRAEHEVLMALRFRKGNHVTHVVGVREHHHQTVDPRRDPSVRWHTVLERVEQVTELRANPFLAEAEHLEDALLQASLVDADAAARDLHPVHHRVVRASANLIGLGVDEAHVL